MHTSTISTHLLSGPRLPVHHHKNDIGAERWRLRLDLFISAYSMTVQPGAKSSSVYSHWVPQMNDGQSASCLFVLALPFICTQAAPAHIGSFEYDLFSYPNLVYCLQILHLYAELCKKHVIKARWPTLQWGDKEILLSTEKVHTELLEGSSADWENTTLSFGLMEL